MANHRTCDNCGKIIHPEKNPVIAKLFLVPVLKGRARATHSDYTGHMDIGQCCVEKVIKGMGWQKRKTKAAKLRATA